MLLIPSVLLLLPTSNGCELGGCKICCWWSQGGDSARQPVFQQEQKDVKKTSTATLHFIAVISIRMNLQMH